MNNKSGAVKTNKRRWLIVVGISVGGVIGMFIILVSLTPLIVSSDMMKNKVINELEIGLDRKVQIEDIKMSWSGGLDIKNIYIEEREGFPGDRFVKIDRILCNIDFIPLIRKQIVINDLMIESPEIVLQKDDEGVFNYEDICKSEKTVSSVESAESTFSDVSVKPARKPKYNPLVIPAILFDLKIIANVNNGKFIFIDNQLKKETTISAFNTTLNIDSLKNPIELKSAFDIGIESEKEHADISLSISLAKDGKIDPENARCMFNMKTGFASITTDFDMARFMGESEPGFDFTMDVDLKKLTDNLAGMLGLPKGVHVEGIISSKITAEGQLKKIIAVDGITEITNLSISGGPLGDKPVLQPNIKLIQKADIDITNDKITIYKIGIDSTFLEMFLAGLVTELKSTRNLNFKIFLDLDITKLMSGFGGLLPEDTEIAGRLKSNISLKGRESVVKLNGKTDLRDFYAKIGATGTVKEPEISINHDIVYDLQNSDLELRRLHVNTGSAEINTSGTVVNNGEINLNMLLTGNIEGLRQSLQGIVPFPESLSIGGEIATKIDIKGHSEKELKVVGTTDLQDINATGGPLENKKISNIDLKLVHIMDYKITKNSVSVEKMDIESDFLKMESKGGIANLSKEKSIDYELFLNMDLNKLTEKFTGVVPEGVIMAGDGIVNLDINGKLLAKENENLFEKINLNGSISIDSVNYNAYEVKDFRTGLALDDGFFMTKDFTFTLNEGTGTVAASADLKDEKPPVVFDMKLLDVEINQNMDLLAYLIPVLAAPEGKLTGKLNMGFNAKGNGLNWRDDLSKNLIGEGDIDIVEGYVEGGKVTSKILKVLGEDGGEYKFDQITTKFVISDSKIHNDDISINGEEFDIGLSGWTSFDGRLEYSANAEALGKYVGRDVRRILKNMSKDSKLPIVVTGTISRPKLAFEWPKPQEIGSILESLLGGSKDSKPQTEDVGRQTQAGTETKTKGVEEEAQPVEEEKENVVEKLLKDFFK